MDAPEWRPEPNVALKLWNGRLPARDPAELVRELYAAENRGKAEPSGSQDMIGLIYPGVNRLDYDFAHEGEFFRHIESNNDPRVPLAGGGHVLAAGCRSADGYNPLGNQEPRCALDPPAGASGKECFDAICARDGSPGADECCMECWEAFSRKPCASALTVDLKGLLALLQSGYCGQCTPLRGGLSVGFRRSPCQRVLDQRSHRETVTAR